MAGKTYAPVQGLNNTGDSPEGRQPLILGDKSYGEITTQVCSVVEDPKVHKAWLISFLTAVTFLGVLFSLIASAERHGVNPRTYLEDVNFQLRALGEKPTDKRLEPFLPDRWKARPVQSRGVANASAGVALALRRGVSFRPNGRNSGRSRVGC